MMGGLNTYGYVGGNPKKFVDPTGLVTAFFGGAMDGTTRIVQNSHANRYSSVDDSQYFEWDQYDEAYDYIVGLAKNNPCQKINLVGHSWGGDSATRVAQRLINDGYRIDMLITVDAAGGNIPGLNSDQSEYGLLNNTGIWFNAYARPSGSYDRSDFIAGVGGPWNDVSNATYSVPVDRHHGEFTDLFELSGAADLYRRNAGSPCQCSK